MNPARKNNRFKNKTLATLLAVLGGLFGLHRFYLNGNNSWRAWLYPTLTVLGMLAAPIWIPALAMTFGVLFTSLIEGLTFAVTPDELWDARWNAGHERRNDSGWTVVITAVLTLGLGATLLMAVLAFSFQSWFERYGTALG